MNRLDNPKVVGGLAIVGVFVFLAIFGPMLAPYNPSTNSSAILQGPSASHLLGTTQVGQDVLSQVLVGTRSSVVIAIIAAVIATVVSIVVGVTSGYLAGAAGELLSAFSNVFLVIPALPLVIVLSGYLHGGGTLEVAIVISVTAWAFGARVLRAQTLSIRQRDFVAAARAIGEGPSRILMREILPLELPIIASGFLLTAVFAIITQATLAFLGLVNISQWSWGTMLYWTYNDQAFTTGAWWWFVPPGLCIALLGTGLGLLNFSVDEFVNPRIRTERKRRRQARKVPGNVATAQPARAADGAVALPEEVLLGCRNVVVAYGAGATAVRAVRDVSTDLRRGRVLGIAGESGCGKSSLAFTIARLLQDPGHVESGEVLFSLPGTQPINLLEVRGEELRKLCWEHFALVPQAALNALNPVLNIGNQLMDAFVDHRGRKNREAAVARCSEALRLVGLGDQVLGSYPHELSGGMRQRVMIAMAIILEPDVIIMDEPTTALDVVTQRQIIERLIALQRELGLSIVFITHDLPLLLEIADDVAIMYAGRIVEQASSRAIRTDPRHPYARGLLASYPAIGTTTVQRLTGIPGSPPDMADLPSGCAFAARCPSALPRCQTDDPALLGGNGHLTACWLADAALRSEDAPASTETTGTSA